MLQGYLKWPSLGFRYGKKRDDAQPRGSFLLSKVIISVTSLKIIGY